MKRFFIAALALIALAAASVSAQNLLDNDAYKKALQLRDQAQAAIAAGNYSQATQLSGQAEDYAKQALQIAQQLALAYRATNWLGLAKDRVAFASTLNAATRFPNAWTTAQAQLSTAQSDYDSKDYPNSITASQAVLAALQSLPASSQNGILPAEYTVRLLPEDRDSFWNIAKYPFVYGDPLKWPVLYRANKQVLQDPNNPNLIQPGMVFTIPSVNGETRSGMWQPPESSGK